MKPSFNAKQNECGVNISTYTPKGTSSEHSFLPHDQHPGVCEEQLCYIWMQLYSILWQKQWHAYLLLHLPRRFCRKCLQCSTNFVQHFLNKSHPHVLVMSRRNVPQKYFSHSSELLSCVELVHLQMFVQVIDDISWGHCIGHIYCMKCRCVTEISQPAQHNCSQISFWVRDRYRRVAREHTINFQYHSVGQP